MHGRNDLCWCGSGNKWKRCHYPKEPPENEGEVVKRLYLKQHGILLKNAEQIVGIRRACQLAVDILDATCARAQEGITTAELNAFAHQLHLDAGARPAPLRYGQPPYPASICTSLNDVICHGIPDKRPLQSGDILNIDVTAILNGYYGDCSRMVTVGTVSEEKQLVADVAYECLMRSIAILKPGIKLHAIGDVIEDYAAQHRCSVVNQFVGHGVGLKFHEGPQIFHSRNNSQLVLVPGMTFTIEPMINAGKREAVIDPVDQWTARTIDGRPSAQWEHTLLLTETGHEILTPWQR